MLRLKVICVFICLVILPIVMIRPVAAAKTFELLTRAMEASGAKIEEYNMNAWVRLPSNLLHDEPSEIILQQVMEQLGVTSEQYQLTRRQNSKQNVIQAEVMMPNIHIVVSIQDILENFKKAESEVYLVINIEEKVAECAADIKTEEKITNIIKKFGASPKINTCLIGSINGKLRVGKWCDPLNNAFKVINAKLIDQFETEHFISYTGFTPQIDRSLQIGNQKINVNIAIRYNQYNDRTDVMIGSPMITKEY